MKYGGQNGYGAWTGFGVNEGQLCEAIAQTLVTEITNSGLM